MITRIAQVTGHSVRRICEVLKVPRSSHYHAASPTLHSLADTELAASITKIFHQHRRRYGHRRICRQLDAEGVICCPRRVRRLMRERQLVALQPKSFTPKTSDGRADAPSPNLLVDQPLPAEPNEAWAGDITHIPTSCGWLYLAVVIDLCSRRIVGWSLADHLRSELVVDAMNKALASRRVTTKLIFHSDRGSQYGSKNFRAVLSRSAIRQSMSARANPYHNAWTESFMGTLKKEMLQDGRFITVNDAHTEIFAFIEGYYNTQRLHSSLDYQTPTQFEKQITHKN
jgi:transposase InsO family protein